MIGRFAEHTIVESHFFYHVCSPKRCSSKAEHQELRAGRSIFPCDQEEIVGLGIDTLTDWHIRPDPLFRQFVVKEWIQQLRLPAPQFEIRNVGKHVQVSHSACIKLSEGLSHKQAFLVYQYNRRQ